MSVDEEDRSTALIGSIDQGTSSTRFLVFSANTGRLLTYHQIEVKQFFPDSGWVEMDPMEILQSTTVCIQETCNKLLEMGFDPGNVKGVGITNQRETSIFWDKRTGKPLHNAIVWLDARTAHLAEELTAQTSSKNADHFKEKSGLPIHPYFSALKLRWMIDNVAEVRKAVETGDALAGTVDTWLIWNLTGGQFVTDVTNASRTLLMNIHTRQWDLELCQFFQIPIETLPQIRSSSEIYGCFSHTNIDGSDRVWLKDVPVSGCLGDQQAALVGQQCFSAGLAKNTYGTGCFLLYNTGTSPVISKHGLLTTVGFQLGPDQPVYYALEGSVAIAGACVRWLRDNLKMIKESAQVEELAASVDDTRGVYFVPAFTGLYAPYWHPAARGILCGLSQYTTQAHVARAALEAVCFQTCEILDSIEKDCGLPLQRLQVDGGMTKNNLVMQMQADLLGTTVVRPQLVETTALGAALAAGMAKGVEVWTAQDTKSTLIGDEFHPKIDSKSRSVRYAKWKDAVTRSMNWATSESPAADNSDQSHGCHKKWTIAVPIVGAAAVGSILGFICGKFIWRR